jgi:hypothetical protein
VGRQAALTAGAAHPVFLNSSRRRFEVFPLSRAHVSLCGIKGVTIDHSVADSLSCSRTYLASIKSGVSGPSLKPP